MWTFLSYSPTKLGGTPPSGSPNPSAHPDRAVESSISAEATDTLPCVVQNQGLAHHAYTAALSPSFISQSIQNAYLPSTFRTTGGMIQRFVARQPPPSDFWEKAKECQGALQEYIPRLLGSLALSFGSTSAHFTQISSAMSRIVSTTTTFREGIQGTLDAHNITLDAFTKELEGVFTAIVNDLKKITAPEKPPGHAERKELVDKVLDDMRLALENIAARYRIQGAVETYLSVIKPHVHALMVAVGDINERHPQLLTTLLFSVAGLLIPESWFLRPFLSVFGFGPLGPVKGSVATWLQRRFWGGRVAAGSWFACLQAAGMGAPPRWLGYTVRLPWMIGTLLVASRGKPIQGKQKENDGQQQVADHGELAN